MEPSTTYATTVPFVLFAAFQLMFAAITPALITGAFAERKKFAAFVTFTVLWSLFIYSPLAHMVWSPDGWLFKLGALDYAGGTVVHISSGVSALVAALMIGKRRKNGEKMDPHDVPMTVLGAGILWFGWFGFNAGSAVAADGRAAMAFMVTTVAAAAGMISWVGVQYARTKKVSVVGAAAGAVAGLVAITPASGFVGVGGALIIGLVVGGLSYLVAGCCESGSTSTMRSTCSRSTAWAACGAPSRRASSRSPRSAASRASSRATRSSSVIQLIAVVVTVAFAAVGTFVIMKIINVAFGARVPEEHEEIGLDLAVHGEAAYQA